MLLKIYKLEPLRLKLKTPRSRRSSHSLKEFHFAELLSFVDAPLAGSKAACTRGVARVLDWRGLERVKRANKGVWGHRPQRLKKITLTKD